MGKITQAQVRSALLRRKKQRQSSPSKSTESPVLTAEILEKTRKATREKLQLLIVEAEKHLEESEAKNDKKNSSFKWKQESDNVDETASTVLSPPESVTETVANVAQEVAEDIENELFKKNHDVGSQYRSDFRRIFFSLKEKDSQLTRKLLDKTITGSQIVHLSVEELMSDKRRQSDAVLKQEALRLHVIEEQLPENVQAFDDGRVAEKWGGGKSAASLDL